VLKYQIHNHGAPGIYKKFPNRKYFILLENLMFSGLKAYFIAKRKNRKVSIYLHTFFLKYGSLYNLLFYKSNTDSFNFIKKTKNKKQRAMYNLILTFNKNKVFMNISDVCKRNYLFLSPGFFIKYFNKKKLYKKSKVIRTLQIKYLRKIFLLLHLPNTILFIKKTPLFLLEILNLFNQEIPHKFNEPVTNREIFDNKPNRLLTVFKYFIFLSNHSYIKFKEKKKGRVKRKITRKIVMRNTIID
jgi:hypothetical protein